MSQRNSPERKAILADRARKQRQRTPTPDVWQPKLIPAWMNRRTGEPHLHERAKARRRWQDPEIHARMWRAA